MKTMNQQIKRTIIISLHKMSVNEIVISKLKDKLGQKTKEKKKENRKEKKAKQNKKTRN